MPASKSDKFGVRANSDAGSLTANQTDYLGDTVPDKTIDELQDGSDLIGATDDPKNVIKFTLINAEFGLDPFTGLPYFCSAQQACLGNHAIVNLGVIGYAYLREPLSFDVSDRISIVFNGSGISGNNLITVTITLDSDPFTNPLDPNTLNPAAAKNEDGTQQDMTSRLFNVASDPNHPFQTG